MTRPLQWSIPVSIPRRATRSAWSMRATAPKRKIRLVANDTIEVHPYLSPSRCRSSRWNFDMPPAATRQGKLTLSWFGEPGLGGNGRGCQVSEVWLMKESSAAQ